MDYKVPLILTPQPEGGYRVTSPLLPELLTEGATLGEALANVSDALAAVVELYDDLGRPLPRSLRLPKTQDPVWLETVVSVPSGSSALNGRPSRPHEQRLCPTAA